MAEGRDKEPTRRRVGSRTPRKCFIGFSRKPAGGSAQTGHLLVHQDEYVFPLLLQQRTVELASAPASSPFGKQELLKLLYHCGHLLIELLGPHNGRGN
jgi:hypothetical protein